MKNQSGSSSLPTPQGMAPDVGQDRQALLSHYKTKVHAEHARLKDDFFKTRAPAPMLAGRCRFIDTLLDELWARSGMGESAALVAVGGYGYGLLYPYSDIDFLILCPETHEDTLTQPIEEFIRFLWDIGLSIGHSVRTPTECLKESTRDITVQTSLLDTRLLSGNPALFSDFLGAFRKALDPKAFFHAKQIEQEERYLRYQESPYSLEPNCKESPGGLRDLQHILWLANASGLGKGWEALEKNNLMTAQESLGLIHRESFLQGLRIFLHFHAGRCEDRLLFDYQKTIAAYMGFTDTPTRRASEQLMQEYFRTAKTVTQLNIILRQNIGANRLSSHQADQSPINARFQRQSQLLDIVDEGVFQKSPSAIFEAFLLMGSDKTLHGLTARTMRALWRARTHIDPSFRDNPIHQALFLSIFQQDTGVLHELRRMNQFGILGRYLPVFGKIIGQMQYDLFHVYTVDQHILQVIRNLRRFSDPAFPHEYPLCSALIAQFERPWVLYIAALFHDIAKGRGLDHSEEGAKEAEAFCIAHGIDSIDTALIVWLVRHHLSMSQVAQKKDISDPDVLKAFSTLVGDERHLIALYLLTVADIRGTGPRLWNAWKGQLLEELFTLSLGVLRSDQRFSIRQWILQDKEAKAKTLIRNKGLSENSYSTLTKALDTVYFLRHSAEEIAWHAEVLEHTIESAHPIVKARALSAGQGIQVMVYTKDMPDLFTHIVGFFSGTGFNIMDAKIHTTIKGYALDSFVIFELNPHHEEAELVPFIEHELTDRLIHFRPSGDAFFSVPLSRLVRHFPIAPSVNISPDEKGEHFVISMNAIDRPGLLYAIAKVLNRYAINLHTAKIATLGERVEDTFLVSGAVLIDTSSRIEVESALLRCLEAR